MSLRQKIKAIALLRGSDEVDKKLLTQYAIEQTKTAKFEKIIEDAVNRMPTCELRETVTLKFELTFTLN